MAKTKDKMKDSSYINKEIDYFNKLEIVEKTIESTGYIPRAMRDQKSIIKLSDMRCDELDKEDQRCELALKRAQEKKNECMKSVLRIKEANRYFFTQNPSAPPFYYPEKTGDENGKKDGKNENDDEENDSKQVSPRTQAKIDSKLLFREDLIPVPCEPAVLKKALEERRKREGRDK